MEFKNGTFFLRTVLAVMSGTLLCSTVDEHWSEPGSSCCWLISHFCRVLAAGSAHSWSCETSPVRAHVHSEGTVCILTTGPEPRKVPRAGSAETAHQPCPGPASSTSHHSRMRTEHDAATFRISFQNRITTYKYMLKNSGLAVGFFNFMFLFFKLMFLLITSKD